MNLDNDETAALAAHLPKEKVVTYSLVRPEADLCAHRLTPSPEGIAFDLLAGDGEDARRVVLRVPGAHNVSNALAALAVAQVSGVELGVAAEGLEGFSGLRRRLEWVGTAGCVTVIDDFAHNPTKSRRASPACTISGPPVGDVSTPRVWSLALDEAAFIDCFAQNLGPEDQLIMPDPVYFGGTVERSVTSHDITDGVVARGRKAQAFAARPACGEALLALARPGDRIVVMARAMIAWRPSRRTWWHAWRNRLKPRRLHSDPSGRASHRKP